jgi:hypothetical protein
MNFDTKHLVRWGIPGWIMIMVIVPFFYFNFDEIRKLFLTINLLAVGAFLTVTGVPLGYLLNQIHHSLFWVIPKLFTKGWKKYFIQEIRLDEIFIESGTKGEKMQQRYSYLLSRKHELGGVSVSLGLCFITLLIYNLLNRDNENWCWIYLIVVFILFVIILISRNYSSRNIDQYFKYYLKK